MNKLSRAWLSMALFTGCLLLWSQPAPALAQIPTSATTSNPSSWGTYIVPLDCQDEDGCDICEITKVFTNGANLIGASLSGMALLMFIVGGLFWIFSAGNEQRIETGKKILVGTVTGVAITFIAWMAVNIIVRTASLSGGKQTAQIFSRDWWNFSDCYPTLPDACTGRYVGAACGFGDCSNDSSNPNCFCWRAVAQGQSTKCTGTDASSAAVVKTADAKATETPCACATSCSILAAKTGLAYQCVAQVKVNDVYTTQKNYTATEEAYTCTQDHYECALPN